MKNFFRALSFLTILPVGKGLASEEEEMARSMAFFPIVGLVIGLLLTLAHYLLSSFLPSSLVLWLTIGLLVLLTGGLHLDGLADTMDGLGSRGTREKVLEVMRDSRIGTFGVIGLVLLIGGKYLALDQISTASIHNSLILMAVMGRYSVVLVCYRSPYARAGKGLGMPFSEGVGNREIGLSMTSALGITLWMMGIKGIVIFLGIGLFSIAYRMFFIRRLGGITGDILGAAIELAELLCLILWVIMERIPI